jgi:uncharacterized membrane protein YbhN (UPF0104 family)
MRRIAEENTAKTVRADARKPAPTSANGGVAGEGVAGEEVARRGVAGEGVAGEDVAGEDVAGRGIAGESRRLRNGLISLAIFFALIAALLLAVPKLRSTGELITDAKPTWVAAGIGLELLSCVGYVILFELVFKMERRFSRQLSLSELAVNSVVSVSGLGGIALGAWVLRTKGVSVERIARRSVLMFVLTSAVNVSAVAAIGLLMWLGVLPGSSNALLTLLPAALAIATIAATLAIAALAGRLAHGRLSSGRLHVALVAVSDGVRGALRLIRRYDWRLLGAVGYCLFDALVLYVSLRAFGPAPTLWVVAMAYLVGLMGNSIPIPAGLVAVEGGLIGMLVLFGVRPVKEVVAAVVIYRAISLWVPALIGSAAFFGMRREIGEPMRAASGGAARS